MTEEPTEAERIAAGLSEAQREIVLALCGNAWEGVPSPGINVCNSLGLMHINVLKNSDGQITHGKAYPTPLGKAVRTILQERPDAK